MLVDHAEERSMFRRRPMEQRRTTVGKGILRDTHRVFVDGQLHEVHGPRADGSTYIICFARLTYH